MPKEQTKSRRKATGGRVKDNRKSRQFALGNNAVLTQIGEKTLRSVRTLGGKIKQRLAATQNIVVTDPATKKSSTQVVEGVSDNAANRNFIRRNIITKGAIVETKLGQVRVTSKPGQNASLAGVLVKK